MISEKEILVDIGFKSEGIIDRSEFTDEDLPTIGDQVEVYLEYLEDSSGNAMTLNSTYRKGFYTKIGHRVIVSGYADVSSVGSASGNMRLTGLPFAVINNVAGYSALTAYPENMNLTAGYSIVGYTGINSSRIILGLTDTATGQSHLQASELGTGNLIINLTYVTA